MREPWADDSDSQFASDDSDAFTDALSEQDAWSDASFDADSSEKEHGTPSAPPSRPGPHGNHHPHPHVVASEDFHECVEGLRLDDGWFSEEAYRGPPARDASAHDADRDPGCGRRRPLLDDARRPGRVRGAFEATPAEADLEPKFLEGSSRAGGGGAADERARRAAPLVHFHSAETEGRTEGGSVVVRGAASRAAAAALWAGARRVGGVEPREDGDPRDDLQTRDLPTSRGLVPNAERLGRVPPTDREALLRDGAMDDDDRDRPGITDDGAGQTVGGVSSDEDAALVAAQSAWMEDTGEAARARRRSRVLRAYNGGETSEESDDDEARARERRLRFRLRRDAREAASDVRTVVPSDRALFLAEERAAGGNPATIHIQTTAPHGANVNGRAADEGARRRPSVPSPSRRRETPPLPASPPLSDKDEERGPLKDARRRSSGRTHRSDCHGAGGGRTGVDPESEWDAALMIGATDPGEGRGASDGRGGEEEEEEDAAGREGRGTPAARVTASAASRWGIRRSPFKPACPTVGPSARTFETESGSGDASVAVERAADETTETADAAATDLLSPSPVAAVGSVSSSLAPSPVPSPSPSPSPSPIPSPPRPEPVSARLVVDRPRSAEGAPRPTTAGASASSARPSSFRGLPRHRAAGGAGPPTPQSRALAADPASASYPLHAAAYYNDRDALRAALFAARGGHVVEGVGAERRGGEEKGGVGAGPPVNGSPPPAAAAAIPGSPGVARAALGGVASADACGNTALHVAVLRGHVGAVDVLLDDDVDFPLEARSAAGWTALQEAVHLGHRRLVKTLLKKQVERSKREFERKKPLLLATLRSLPDFRMRIHWEFGSMVFGPVLRRYAPSDTYEVTKRGCDLRMDGTLKGVETEEDGTSRSVLPKWKRGAFSLLFEGKMGESRLLLVDHEKREAVDTGDAADAKQDEAAAEAMNTTEEERLDQEVDLMLSEGSTKRKLKTEEVNFRPVKGWLGGNKREKVEGWQTEVWEASGLMTKRLVTRAGSFKVNGTFSEYLAAAADGHGDVVESVQLGDMEDGDEGLEDLEREASEAQSSGLTGDSELGIDDDGFEGPVRKPRVRPSRRSPSADERRTGGGGGAGSPSTSASKDDAVRGGKGRAGASSRSRSSPRSPSSDASLPPGLRRGKPAKEAKPRKITARCWLAEGFPLTVDDLMPILDVMSHANKHLKKVNRFVQYWRGEHGGFFPVKVLVPIVMTVYAVMRFQDFTLLPKDGSSGLAPDHFKVPPGYKEKTLVEALKEAEAEERRLLAQEMKERENESAAMKAKLGPKKGGAGAGARTREGEEGDIGAEGGDASDRFDDASGDRRAPPSGSRAAVYGGNDDAGTGDGDSVESDDGGVGTLGATLEARARSAQEEELM